MNRFLFLEYCDYCTVPKGGQLTFAKQMLEVFLPEEIVLAGVSGDPKDVGRWTKRRIQDRDYDFFAVDCFRSRVGKPRIPLRLRALGKFARWARRIRQCGVRHVFTQSPEALWVASKLRWESLCHRMAGVENPVYHSRYPWARPLAGWFERSLFRALSKTDVALACADEQAIRHLILRGRGRLAAERVRRFPTRVDTAFYSPVPEEYSLRARLGFDAAVPVFVVNGRLNRYKGWPLILEAFTVFRKESNGVLVFLGDGEDRQSLENAARAGDQGQDVLITGFQESERVADYLRVADVCLVGSVKEGWSLAMLEALSCGRRIVCTDVSGARELVQDGVNGYIVPQRCPVQFAAAMKKALGLSNYPAVSRAIAERYSITHLREDLLHVWPALTQ